MFLNSSVSTKLFFGLAVFIFLFVSGIWLANLGNSVSLDSDNKEIVEEFNAGESSFFSKILPQESPVASALVFAGSLEERLYGVFRGTTSNSIDAALGGPVEGSDANRLETVGGNSVVASLPVLTIIPASGFVTFEEGDVLTYEIEEGDSLESIASDFGISVSALISVNNMPANTKLKLGDKLAILPVDGVKHTVKSGETIQNLALKYKADADRIIAFNDLPDNAIIRPGDVLIIPGGEHVPLSLKVAPPKSPSPQTLPNLVGYYGLPSGGRVTFGLHKYNAVDVGGKDWCNPPIYAAAAGTIITADAQGWNGGYGKYIKIAHENGTITLYAHASQLLTNIGQFVAKGQTIALVGSTGRSTGCHVHFEVRGARNPLAR